jgi:hypothetical protein
MPVEGIFPDERSYFIARLRSQRLSLNLVEQAVTLGGARTGVLTLSSSKEEKSHSHNGPSEKEHLPK